MNREFQSSPQNAFTQSPNRERNAARPACPALYAYVDYQQFIGAIPPLKGDQGSFTVNDSSTSDEKQYFEWMWRNVFAGLSPLTSFSAFGAYGGGAECAQNLRQRFKRVAGTYTGKKWVSTSLVAFDYAYEVLFDSTIQPSYAIATSFVPGGCSYAYAKNTDDETFEATLDPSDGSVAQTGTKSTIEEVLYAAPGVGEENHDYYSLALSAGCSATWSAVAAGDEITISLTINVAANFHRAVELGGSAAYTIELEWVYSEPWTYDDLIAQVTAMLTAAKINNLGYTYNLPGNVKLFDYSWGGSGDPIAKLAWQNAYECLYSSYLDVWPNEVVVASRTPFGGIDGAALEVRGQGSGPSSFDYGQAKVRCRVKDECCLFSTEQVLPGEPSDEITTSDVNADGCDNTAGVDPGDTHCSGPTALAPGDHVVMPADMHFEIGRMSVLRNYVHTSEGCVEDVPEVECCGFT